MNLQEAGDYIIDVSEIKFWYKNSDLTKSCGSYDEKSQILNLTEQWKAGVFYLNDFDASDYRYIRIDYEPKEDGGAENLPFMIQCRYGDGKSESKLCERKRKVQYLELNEELKKDIKEIQIWCLTETPISYKINKLCLTKNKILSPAVVDDGHVEFDSSIPAVTFVKNMELGWNLGNTFDASSFSWQENYRLRGIETEFDWEKTETTKELIDFPFDNGYKTIRIPVTWFNHIIDDKYTIDPDWMIRVKTIVDYAIAKGYYVILDEHHSVRGDRETITKTLSDGSLSYEKRAMPSPLGYADGYILSSNKQDQEESKRFLKAIWTQIATAFNNGYDEHLIFETMNEPRNPRDTHPGTYNNLTVHEWQPALKLPYHDSKGVIGGYWCDNLECKECCAEYEVLNEYNQVCLDAIRSTGGNNANRFVLIPGMCSSVEPVLQKIADEEHGIFSPGLFRMPHDSATDKLILTIHRYPNWNDETTFTTRMKNDITDLFSVLNEQYISKGIPVVIGETGAAKSSIIFEERLKWSMHLLKTARQYGMAVIWWDCGTDKNSTAEIDRVNKVFIEPELVSMMLKQMSE